VVAQFWNLGGFLGFHGLFLSKKSILLLSSKELRPRCPWACNHKPWFQRNLRHLPEQGSNLRPSG
jgi:hypothetical protein